MLAAPFSLGRVEGAVGAVVAEVDVVVHRRPVGVPEQPMHLLGDPRVFAPLALHPLVAVVAEDGTGVVNLWDSFLGH